MNTKLISNRALSVIDQYLHFKYANASATIPYFNNKTVRTRAALRAKIGKGSPKDIYDEVEDLIIKSRVDKNAIGNDDLKKILTDKNIGIECSGFAYYVLNAESEERNLGSLSKKISFSNCKGIVGKIRCAIRPVENCDVMTFAGDDNSRVIPIKEVQPGDMIVMLSDEEESVRDHIVIVHKVEYQNFVPTKISYTHSIAYPEDGIYGTGVRQGEIQILNSDKPINEQIWIEEGRENTNNRLFVRAQKSKTEIRRLSWF